MFKKIVILSSATFLLGGCTLTDAFKLNNAARTETTPVATTTPAPLPSPSPSEDSELKAMPSTSSANDEKSLETDINNTTILKEDFSIVK